MRKSALAVLFACTMLATSSSSASVSALELLQLDDQSNNKVATFNQQVTLASLNRTPVDLTPKQPPQEPEIVKYKVAANDSLTTIAEQHNTSWKRLFDKNEAVSHPDVIKIGDELTIPRADEILKERPVPQTPQDSVTTPQPAATTPTVNKRATAPAPKPTARATVQARGAVAGNTYTAGYCTWYVKNRRPDLPNNLGNADTWVARARAQGIATGSTPRAGAAGQRGMHVVYVESVNSDGSVNISEMNHKGLYVITQRTLPGNYFQYIY